MCDILKDVNNIMHQQSIVGYRGDILDLGRLLMQGPLEVYVGRKKDKVVAGSKGTARRHVFLYERCVMFCKKRDGEGSERSDRDFYAFKNSLPVSDEGELGRGCRGRGRRGGRTAQSRGREVWDKREVR